MAEQESGQLFTFDQVWQSTAEQVRRDLIVAIEPHIESVLSKNAVELILNLEGS